MRNFLENLDKYLKYYFLISIIALAAVIFFIVGRLYRIETYLGGLKNETFTQEVDVCGSECRKQIEAVVAEMAATPSAVPAVKPVSSNTKTTYIPLIGPVTATGKDWTDAPGTDVYIDLVNDYKSSKTWVSWEAFLSADNGQASARLFDVTHGLAVGGSELTTDSKSLAQLISGNIYLWAGKNLYRVQLKSVNSLPVTFGSGRIKINY